MSLSLVQTLSAVGPGITSSFLASGGTAPYTYVVRSTPWQTTQGQFFPAGGSINSSSGLYTAPAAFPVNANAQYDQILVTDSSTPTPLTAQASIMVGDPLLLFCDVIQQGLGLSTGRVYLWDQKMPMPTDSGLYVAVSVLTCKAFGNNNSHSSSGGGLNSNQSVNMASTLQVDIISRDNSARLQKEGVLLALNSDYSEQQQNANNFYIGKLPPGAQFNNLSSQDGAAIPYRFVISVQIQYLYTATKAVGYMTPVTKPTVNYVQS